MSGTYSTRGIRLRHWICSCQAGMAYSPQCTNKPKRFSKNQSRPSPNRRLFCASISPPMVCAHAPLTITWWSTHCHGLVRLGGWCCAAQSIESCHADCALHLEPNGISSHDACPVLRPASVHDIASRVGCEEAEVPAGCEHPL